MKTKLYAILLLTFTCTTLTLASSSEVFKMPYEFKAGDAAVASEVNQNFQALADAFATLQMRTTHIFEKPADFVAPTYLAEGLTPGTWVDDPSGAVGNACTTSPCDLPLVPLQVQLIAAKGQSFDRNSDVLYQVRALGDTANPSPIVTYASYPVAFAQSNSQWEKTVLNGYSTMVGVSYTPGMSVNGPITNGACNIEIKLDEATYVRWTPVGFFGEPGSHTPVVWTKAELQAHYNTCKSYLAWIRPYKDTDFP